MSPSVQSCSGREMKLLNFLVVVVVIVSGWRKTVMYGLSCGFLFYTGDSFKYCIKDFCMLFVSRH
jgi:hypothetical protein